MVAADDGDGAERACRRDTEAVALALDDERRDGNGVELGQAARAGERLPWRAAAGAGTRGRGRPRLPVALRCGTRRGRRRNGRRRRAAPGGEPAARRCSTTAIQAASSWWRARASAGRRRDRAARRARPPEAEARAAAAARDEVRERRRRRPRRGPKRGPARSASGVEMDVRGASAWQCRSPSGLAKQNRVDRGHAVRLMGGGGPPPLDRGDAWRETRTLEIPAADAARRAAFWGGLFGWELQAFGDAVPYLMTRFSEESGGAMYEDASPRGMRVYFDVDDIDAGAGKVRELGGEAGDKMPVPSMGWSRTARIPRATSSASGRRPVGVDSAQTGLKAGAAASRRPQCPAGPACTCEGGAGHQSGRRRAGEE